MTYGESSLQSQLIQNKQKWDWNKPGLMFINQYHLLNFKPLGSYFSKCQNLEWSIANSQVTNFSCFLISDFLYVYVDPLNLTYLRLSFILFSDFVDEIFYVP